MKNNRLGLSFGLMISTVVSIILMIVFIKLLKAGEDLGNNALMLAVCIITIILNTSAFITTDLPAEKFQKVKWRAILALSTLVILFLYLMVMTIVKRNLLIFALLFVTFGAMVLELLGITQKIRVREQKK